MDRLAARTVVDAPPGADDADIGDASPVPRRRPPARWLVLAVGALLALALAAVLLTRGPDTPPVTAADVNRSVQQGLDQAKKDARQAPPDAAVAFKTAQPSLVTVVTQRTSSAGDQRGTGAGVVVSAKGDVLTALHVVDGASTIRVTFADGTESSATVAKQERDSDIAVLTPATLPQVVVPAVLGGGARVGDPVFALGHPLGLTQSLTAGVVSALDRSVRVEADRTLKGLIQFDAAVNPGSSGGPLLNRDGQVIGIVTGLANPSEQSFFVGIGFAVPIATAGGVAGSPPQ